MERQYAAFISYRHIKKDAEIASFLHRSIERYRIPSRYQKDGVHFGYVFRDEEELAASGSLSEKIEEALDHSEFLIVICSKDTPESRWISKEIRYFLRHHDYHHVIAVLTEGEPNESFPKELTEITDDEGNVVQVIEPRAADFRQSDGRGQKPRRKTELIRIYATMLGCNFDDLVLRQQKQQRRNILLISAGISLVLMSFIGMLLYKNRQLENQNEILITQKQEIQLQQSELLTKQAEDALDQDKPLDAIRYALDALPENKEDDKPYYAEAEAILLNATNVFNMYYNNDLYLDHRMVSAPGQTDDWALSTDGRYLVFLNRASEISAYDPITGDLLWNNSIEKRFLSGISGKLKIDEVHRLVLGKFYDKLYAFDLDTGEPVWEKDASLPVSSTFTFSDNNEFAAYIDEVHLLEKNPFLSRYELVVVKMQSGEEICRVTFIEEGSIFQTFFKEDSDSLAGCFSEEGDLFVLTYESEDVIHYCVFDVKQNEIISDFAEESEQYNIIEMTMGKDGQSFYVVYKNKDIDKLAEIKKYNLTGELLLAFETPEEKRRTQDYEISYYFPSDRYGIFYIGDLELLYGGEYLYLYNLREDEWIGYKHFPDNIITMQSIGEGMQGIILENGNYYICSIAEDHQYDILTNKKLDSCIKAVFGNGGYIKNPDMMNGEIRASEKDYRDSYGVVVTENENNEVSTYFLRKIDLQLNEQECSGLSDVEHIWEFQKINQDYFVIGGVDHEFYIYVGDIDHLKRIGSFDYSLSHEYYVFPDLSGFMVVNQDGAIEKYDLTQLSGQTLTEEVSELMGKHGDVNLFGSLSVADATYLEDGSVMTVYCYDDRMQWWLNDEKQEDIVLPDDLHWGYRGNAAFSRMLYTLPDGKILLSDFGNSRNMERFCIYDTNNRTWSYIEDYGKGSDDRIVAYGSQKQILSVLEEDLYLRVYDTEQKELLHEWQTGIPLDDVSLMQFILNDEYLLIGYRNNLIQIYTADDFRLVFEKEFYHGDNIRITKDSENRRLYLYSGGHAGLCLDPDSWTELSELSYPYLFDAETDTLFYESTDGFYFRKIPGLHQLTAELKDLLK